jgi:hypothetical protein
MGQKSMEPYAILLSGPVAFALSVVYCTIVSKYVRAIERLRWHCYLLSLVLLGLFCIELVFLCALGPVRSRATLGPGFSVAHITFFFLGTPALCNTLILAPRRPHVANPYVAGMICAIFAVFLLLIQYWVAEALYGADGKDGPYS